MSTYTVRQFAERIGVSVKTVQRWDREGRLTPNEPQGIGAYTPLAQRQRPTPPRKTIVYLRVSSQAQKPDLENQRRALETFCSVLATP